MSVGRMPEDLDWIWAWWSASFSLEEPPRHWIWSSGCPDGLAGFHEHGWEPAYSDSMVGEYVRESRSLRVVV